MRFKSFNPVLQKMCLIRYVVTLMAMVVEFIESLEIKMKIAHTVPTADESMRNLVSTVHA